MNRDIKDIIKDIKTTTKEANIKYDDVPYAARGAYGIKIREAQDKLPSLKEELKQAIIPNKLTAVFATGSKRTINEVSNFIQENGGITLNASALYDSVTDAVEATYGTHRTFGVTQFVAMMNQLRTIAADLGCEVFQPDFKGSMEIVCKTKQDTLAHVREIIKKFISDELNRKFLTKSLMDSILSGTVDTKQVAVLVTGTQSLEDKAILAALFANSTEYNFQTNFVVTKPNIAKLFKNPEKGNNATTGDE